MSAQILPYIVLYVQTTIYIHFYVIDTQDSQMYVQAILNIYKKYNALVLTSFHNDRRFMEALDRVN